MMMTMKQQLHTISGGGNSGKQLEVPRDVIAPIRGNRDQLSAIFPCFVRIYKYGCPFKIFTIVKIQLTVI